MQIDTLEDCSFLLREVFVPVTLETADGRRISLCMRDDTFELAFGGRFFRANPATGMIEEIK